MEEQIIIGPRAQESRAMRILVAERFDLGQINKSLDLGGTFNLNLAVDTAKRRYVVRCYRPWVTKARLLQVQKVRRYLRQANVPNPDPLVSLRDESFMYYEDRLIEVEPFVEHDAEADSWPRYANAFSVLGLLHTYLAEFPAQGFVAPLVSNYESPTLLLNWTQQLKELIAQTRTHKDRKETATNFCTITTQLLTEISLWWNSQGQQLPRQLTHGDYGGSNVLFQEERIVSLLDFDFLSVRERVFELAYTLYWWLLYRSGNTLASKAEWARGKELLAHYEANATQPLSPEELRALPFELARVPLYWIAEARFAPNPVQVMLKLAARIEQARWILEHREELARIFGA